MNRIGSVIKGFSDRLEKAGVFSPERDAASIVAHVLEMDVEQISKILESELNVESLAKAETFIGRREKREPLHRILGSMVFCGLKIRVADDVFRPCPETEHLVDIALSFLDKKTNQPIRILDLGTGTGCILLALLKALPNATGIGVDIEEPILEAARKNAQENDLLDRATFQLSDWGRDVEDSFDFIISNPPAIATKKIPSYPPEIRDHNPLVSLDGGKDGLGFYKAIAKDFDRLAKSGASGLFRVYSERREASVFDAAGFPVQLVTDYKGQPYALMVANEKRKGGWMKRFLPFC